MSLALISWRESCAGWVFCADNQKWVGVLGLLCPKCPCRKLLPVVKHGYNRFPDLFALFRHLLAMASAISAMTSALCQTDGSPARIGPYQEDLFSTPPSRLVRAKRNYSKKKCAKRNYSKKKYLGGCQRRQPVRPLPFLPLRHAVSDYTSY
jgi:hypothetical protein